MRSSTFLPDFYVKVFFQIIYTNYFDKPLFYPTHAQQLVIIRWMDSCIPKEEEEDTKTSFQICRSL